MDTVTEQRRESGPPRTEAARTSRGFRTDIQALRAIAVLAVVVNHLWPGSLTGGYVGVDVFFVISGFLISSHLDREIVATGRVRLGRFYARRIRRLLPAAFLVLAFSLVAAYFLLPYPRWEAIAQESFASATYWENWLLAAKSVDYSAADAAASLVQHYWSLSVEEQFYLVWPLLLLGLFLVRRRSAQLIGIAVVGVGSLAFSVYYTQASPSEAYFVTPVRVWEFALGAIVALAGARLGLPRIAAGLASFAGLAMIIGSAAGYDHHTPFPGSLALVPTVGTALVIIAGQRPGRQWHTVVTASWPVQFVGNISYSLYLWHWPLILLAPFALKDVLRAGTLPTPYVFAVLGAALLLAFGSKYLVEDRGMALTRHTGATFTAMIAGLVAVSTVAYGLAWTYDRLVVQAEREVEVTAQRTVSCHGAQARIPANECREPFGPARVVDMGPANKYYENAPECRALDDYMVGSKKTTLVCDFSRGARSPEVVWLVGDSHAQQWQGPMFDLARERRWVLKLSYLGGCPFADIEFSGYHGPAPETNTRPCMEWTAKMADVIADDSPSAVVVSFYAREEFADDGTDRSQTEQYRAGLEPFWKKWTDAGARVAVLSDPPLNAEVRALDCASLNADDPAACAVDRRVAQPPDPLSEVASTSRNPEVSFVDLTNYFCDKRRCYTVVGNVVVYYDANHLNLEFSRSMKPMIGRALDR
ncbi:MAG: acyltransferase family protein [Actinophytocola sp.]|uniref:acyltransferase family protein n=1 Tax=Actinophytocola sp. TaxID=1872138 RepID=UPI00132530BE|nr:acyltransferase family protein [Actinophytocola sp.]MPZ84854.1 acyltransferase family protein [Actinophytocola sp.]